MADREDVELVIYLDNLFVMRGYRQISDFSLSELELYMLDNGLEAPFYEEIKDLYKEIEKKIEVLETTDSEDFQQCNSVEMFSKYLSKYDLPYYKGKYLEEAKEEVFYAEQKGYVNGLKYYLNEYPEGKYKDIAQETICFEESKNSLEGLKTYTSKYPDGIFFKEAADKINEMESSGCVWMILAVIGVSIFLLCVI